MSMVTWTINQYVVLGAALVLFAYIGFRRGVNRELFSAAGVVLGMLIADGLAPSLVDQVNRGFKLVRFALGGGIGGADPSTAWQAAKGQPDLVRTGEDIQKLSLVVFAFVVTLVYLLSGRVVRAPGSPALRLLGGVAGAINGFLVAYYLVPMLFTGTQAVISMPGTELTTFLTDAQTLALIALVFVAVLIAFGLHNAGSVRKRD